MPAACMQLIHQNMDPLFFSKAANSGVASGVSFSSIRDLCICSQYGSTPLVDAAEANKVDVFECLQEEITNKQVCVHTKYDRHAIVSVRCTMLLGMRTYVCINVSCSVILLLCQRLMYTYVCTYCVYVCIWDIYVHAYGCKYVYMYMCIYNSELHHAL
jgi:hypothetical protein